ncbi:MAG: DUF1273 domain-containing protein [Ruminococcaceae bacterium]|nr:DUF1273 domain-containing protein [Oscillospiraceae bacterium]
MKTAVFIGHNECYGLSDEQLINTIIKCINNGVTVFLNGGQGGFDRKCALAVFKLKNTFPQIKNVLVIPYLTFNIFNKDIFDEIIFPEGFEKYHFKAAIPNRNKYMVNCSDIAVCYINHGWGNAIKTFEYAQKKNLKIINLSNYSLSLS